MQTSLRDGYSRRPAAFTLIELILVLFIMCMLTFMTIPMLSQLLKGSKVQQTVSIISTTLYRARMDAMRTRKLVGVFFGDDLAACTNQPALGVIPPKGRIEIWTVKDNRPSVTTPGQLNAINSRSLSTLFAPLKG